VGSVDWIKLRLRSLFILDVVRPPLLWRPALLSALQVHHKKLLANKSWGNLPSKDIIPVLQSHLFSDPSGLLPSYQAGICQFHQAVGKFFSGGKKKNPNFLFFFSQTFFLVFFFHTENYHRQLGNWNPAELPAPSWNPKFTISYPE